MAQAGGGRTKVHSFRPVEPGDLALIRRHSQGRADGRWNEFLELTSKDEGHLFKFNSATYLTLPSN
jgi:hypothetical protein